MTGHAILRELVARMARIHGPVVIGLMTLDAVGVSDVVIAVHMTRLTRLGNMCALQRKCSVVVIEGRGSPCIESMARHTVVTELSGGMRRILRRVIVGFMALPAVRICEVVVAVDVAGLTGLRNVGALQREIRRGMIKGRGFPARVCMTGGTVVTELP